MLKKFYQATVLLLLITLVGSFSSLPVTSADNSRRVEDQKPKVESTDLNTRSNGEVSYGGFVGAYIRDSNNATESNVTIGGRFTTMDGDPIADSELEVSLWKGGGQRTFVGTWYTGENGHFTITFKYTADFPSGNVTVNVTAPPQPLGGFGGATKLYNVSVYVRTFNEVVVHSADREIPSFENNPIINVTNRLEYDNGSLVTQEPLQVNVSLFNQTEFLEYKSVNITEGETDFSFSLNESSNGIYSINSSLWLDRPPNNITFDSPWVIGAEAFLTKDNESAGLMLSNGSDTFEVINASRVLLYTADPATANRSGQVVTIQGRHLNTSGGAAVGIPLNLTLSPSEGPPWLYESEKANNTYSNFTINDSGYFTWKISVNASYEVGSYHISADDNISERCITDALTLRVQSSLDIRDVLLPPKRIKVGETWHLSGMVVDPVDNSSVTVAIDVFFNVNYSAFTTLVNETFFTEAEITDNVSSSNVLVTINVSGQFYLEERFTDVISCYNYVIGSVDVGNRAYVWYDSVNTVFQGENTSISVEPNTTLLILFNLTDDFNRTFSGQINVSIALESFTLSYPNQSSIEFNVSEGGDIEVEFPLFHENVTITILIEEGTGGGDNEWFSLPLSMTIVIGVLGIIGSVGTVGFFVFSREGVQAQKRTLGELLVEIKGQLNSATRYELLKLTKDALELVGVHFEIEWKVDWTPREFFLKLIKSRKSYSFEEILKEIYPHYEEALFSEKSNWREHLMVVYNKLSQLNEKLMEKEEKSA
ncbi:MAG: hypothetical protein GWO20_11560 [Candidatus Korarchaeota archaeon]|nr:hypothetical protein [Candidatus Korarchaeota archaeon]NIU84080.1 hypothetical protein [Candidatus Thorarchaeota archaeon]NIW13408.1 hypothetical protein [Candidatus Thorarchaeota archaeon]NIW51533.1 hypothetical protein [Candidatus Korarchaeota archaeon]